MLLHTRECNLACALSHYNLIVLASLIQILEDEAIMPLSYIYILPYLSIKNAGYRTFREHGVFTAWAISRRLMKCGQTAVCTYIEL